MYHPVCEMERLDSGRRSLSSTAAEAKNSTRLKTDDSRLDPPHAGRLRVPAAPRLRAKRELWTTGEGPHGGYFMFNGPQLLVLPNDVVLSLVGARKDWNSSREDNAGARNWQDVMFKRSSDSGNSWTAATVLYSESDPRPGGRRTVIGCQAGVYETRSRRVFVLLERNNSAVLLLHSDTLGSTWSAPRDISAEVKPPRLRWGGSAAQAHGQIAVKLVPGATRDVSMLC